VRTCRKGPSPSLDIVLGGDILTGVDCPHLPARNPLDAHEQHSQRIVREKRVPSKYDLTTTLVSVRFPDSSGIPSLHIIATYHRGIYDQVKRPPSSVIQASARVGPKVRKQRGSR
jgi:hypothetical protein